jgi:hypothetical protein
MAKPITAIDKQLSGFAQQQAQRTESLAVLQGMRREARDEISRLIQFLDQSDDYVMTELEDVGDHEPTLGSFDQMKNQEKSYFQRLGVLAFEVDAELDDADSEPSLGALENHPTTAPSGQANRPSELRDGNGNQSFWDYGGQADDREDDAGDNPEEDPAESGIADEDGLREQYGY